MDALKPRPPTSALSKVVLSGPVLWLDWPAIIEEVLATFPVQSQSESLSHNYALIDKGLLSAPVSVSFSLALPPFKMKKLLNKVRRSNESKESNVNSAGETAATKELPQQPITAEKQLTNDLGASPKRRSSIFSSLKKKKQTSGAVSSSSLASQRSSSSSSASNVNVIAAHQQHQLQSAGVNGNSFVLATSILSAEEAAAVSAQQQQSADILLEEPEEEVQEEEVEIAALPPASVLESTSRITVPASELPQHPSLLSAQIPSDLSSVMSVSSEKSLGDKMLDLPTNDIVNTTNVNFSTTETATVPVTPLKFPASLTSLQLLSYRAAYLQAVEAKSVAEAQLLQLQNIPAIAPLEDQGLVEKTLYLSEEISRLR